MADNTTATKFCPKCERELPGTAFWKQSAAPDGLQNRCKECFYEHRRAADERYIASGKHATKQRAWWYRAKYGVSVEYVDQLLAEQDFRCALCRGPSGARGFHLDHDHKTGRIRGLLCYRCNSALGYFRDDPELMIAAAFYVRSLS